MRPLVLTFLLVPLVGVAAGDDKQPPAKKDLIAELAGTWKNDAMEVNGRRFEAVVLTIQPDGKGKSTYKEKKGPEFKQHVAEVRVGLAKVEGTDIIVTVIEDYLGVYWKVGRHSPTGIIATAIYSTPEGLTAVDHEFKKVPEKGK